MCHFLSITNVHCLTVERTDDRHDNDVPVELSEIQLYAALPNRRVAGIH